MNPKLNYAWSAYCEYQGHTAFYLGTVVLPIEAKDHEVDAALLDLWKSISPHPAPKMEARRGSVFFVPESD